MPTQNGLVAGRAICQRTGTPPSVSPMNRLYIAQRCSTTASLTGPAPKRIATAAAMPTRPKTMNELFRRRSPLRSANAWMKRG